jgi:signal transduction histidine kinase
MPATPSPGPRVASRQASRRHWRHRLAHSLHWRLVALFLLLALGTTLVFVGGTRELFSSGWRELVRPLMSDYIDRLAAEIGSPPDPAKASALTQRLPISVSISGPVVNWRSHPERGERAGRDTARGSMFARITADGHQLRFGLGSWQWDDDRPRLFGWLTLGALLVLTALAFLYVRRLLRPLDDIRAGVLRYGAGDFSRAIGVRRHDELGDLTLQVNAMATSLQRMLEGQRGLLLAISHELRSPLTRARLNAELVADGPERQAMLRDLAQMRDLIADLLESERLAAGHAALQLEPVDLNRLVTEQVAALPPGSPVTLALADGLPSLRLDRSRMQLLLRNLLDNALRHGGGSEVTVATGLDGQALHLSVRDHGPGVPDAQRRRLAEPFYRPDAARTRASGGVGLGLTLCRLVASSHGGTLGFDDAAPGLRVTVRLPLEGVAARPG